MTLTEWRDHLEILGPDLSVWPPRLAEAGLTLLSGSPAAQDLFSAASGVGEPGPAGGPGESRLDR
jgi:hypothetical protein